MLQQNNDPESKRRELETKEGESEVKEFWIISDSCDYYIGTLYYQGDRTFNSERHKARVFDSREEAVKVIKGFKDNSFMKPVKVKQHEIESNA